MDESQGCCTNLKLKADSGYETYQEPSTKKLRQFVETIRDSVAEGDLGLATGFLPLARIQVLWTLGSGGDGDPEVEHWWNATVVGKTSKMHLLPKHEDEEDDPGALDRLPVYQIRYDELPPDFPDPEMAEVCILDDHHLLDASTADGPTYPWRIQGSTWEEEDDEENGEEVERELPPALKLLEAIASSEGTGTLSQDSENEESAQQLGPEESKKMAEAFVEQLMTDLTSRHKSDLAKMPMSEQMAIVDNVHKIQKTLVSKVARCLSSTGRLSAEDAKRIVDELRTAA